MTACPKCGFALAPDAVDCPACGIVLTKFRSSQPAVEAQPLLPPAPVANQPPALQISQLTLDSLAQARRWLQLIVFCNFLAIGLMAIVVAFMFYASLDNPTLAPLSMGYLFSVLVWFTLLLPLHQSASALAQLPTTEAASALERFIVHQTNFWRRSGILTAISVAFSVVVLVASGLYRSLPAMMKSLAP